jgi:PPM family protein phosphatase
MKISVGARTDVGRVRSANEDSYLVREPIFVVADRMGGHLAGDVASSTAVSTIEGHLSEAAPDQPDSFATLVRGANRAIWEKAQSDSALRGMGTTCTLLYLDDATAHIAHVGDSRAYRLRDGTLEQLTEDHTLVARMVREGKLAPEEAEHHPQRSIITRALGVDSDVSVDLLAVELRPGDRLLLCSDGLSSMVEESSILDVLGREQDAQGAADTLVDRANEAGGEDNVTVLIIDVAEASVESDLSATASRESDLSATSGKSDLSATTSAGPVAPDPPARADTPGELPPEVRVSARPRRWLRRLTGLLLLGALGTAAVWAADYTLEHSWFVGVNDDGLVTIYRGIPEEIAGISFREEHEVSDVALADLPEWKREDVRNEMKFDSLDGARSNITNLERLSRESEQSAAKIGG